MHSFSFLSFLLLALLSLAAAASTSGIQKRSFAVKRVANPNFAGRDGPAALAKAYRKFGAPLPRHLAAVMEKRELQRRGLETGTAPTPNRRRDMPGVSFGARVSLAGTMQDGQLQPRQDDQQQQGEQPPAEQQQEEQPPPTATQSEGEAPSATDAPADGDKAPDAPAEEQPAPETEAPTDGQPAPETEAPTDGQPAPETEAPTDGQPAPETEAPADGQPAPADGQPAPETEAPADGQSPPETQGQQVPEEQKQRGGQRGSEMGENQKGSTAAIPAKNDAEFLSPVEIGGQKLNLIFDTGSSDLWVFNSELPASQTQGHQVYNPAASRTFRPMDNLQFRISYGDGSGAEGGVGMDIVSVGGAKAAQPVQLATAVTQTFAQDQNNDGLMGLAFGKINTVQPQKQNTFFENVRDSLNEPVFTADLSGGSAGTYTFGSIDRRRFKGDLAWIPANTTMGFWQFSSEKFAVGGGQPQPATSGGQAIADTGTTLIMADSKIVEGYYSQVKGAKFDQRNGGFTFPCNAQMPDLDLDIGGVYMARVAGEDIKFAEAGGGLCFGGVQEVPQGVMGIYGDVFFKSQFVAFNGGNNTLGMARHV
ncbi:hypothetical protein CDD83_9429 [Cordyceps sp. RAO-2017]|nr:hypothetical protein CDD83_9429 [Cordyceps sp. RAO-2017]